MLLSISSSKLRQTASDRPGVAQPVPLRDIPAQPWNRIAVAALAMLLLMLGAWEWHWRAFGATPSIRNTDALWAIQRRSIDNGEGGATVLVGDSRMFFNLQLPVWERLDGKRPIQLSFEGTSPLRFMEDLAADPRFTGRLLVNIAPVMFFEEFGRHAAALAYYAHESPSQRVGQWLSMRLIEPVFAFDDPDFALAAVIERQPWPDRPGRRALAEPRKISMLEADRSAHLWSKVETDAEYCALVRAVWMRRFALWKVDPPPEKIRQIAQEQIDRAAKAVATLHARGVEVLFVRMPSAGPFLELENSIFPRVGTWNALLTATGAPGIHFEDYPELQGLDLPEWSHLSRADAERFTESLYRILERDFGGMVTAKEAPIYR
jgi:hypothetical protein